MHREANKKLNHKVIDACLERDVVMKAADLLGCWRCFLIVDMKRVPLFTMIVVSVFLTILVNIIVRLFR